MLCYRMILCINVTLLNLIYIPMYHQRLFGKIFNHPIGIYNYIYRIVIDHALFNHISPSTQSLVYFCSLLDLVCMRGSGEYIEKENNHYPLVTMTFYIHNSYILYILFCSVYWDVYMERMEYKTNLIKVLNRRDDC